MNFGAALRSAFFLGAAGVLSCARNSSPLSPVVSKASAGASAVSSSLKLVICCLGPIYEAAFYTACARVCRRARGSLITAHGSCH